MPWPAARAWARCPRWHPSLGTGDARPRGEAGCLTRGPGRAPRWPRLTDLGRCDSRQVTVNGIASGMRVGLVCGHFDPARDGVADYTRRLAEHLQTAGLDPLIATAYCYDEAHPRALGVTASWDASGVLVAARMLARLELDAVHVQFAPSAFGFRRAVGLLPQLLPAWLPVLTTLHEYGVWAPPRARARSRRALWSMLERRSRVDRETLFLVSRARQVLVTSTEHLRTLHARFPPQAIPALEVPIGPNVDLLPIDRQEVRAAVRRKLGMPPDAPLVVFFGFLHPEKGLERLITAAARVRRVRPGLRLVLIGGAESHSVRGSAAAKLRTRLKRTAGEEGMSENVILTGYLPEAEVSHLLQAADAAAFPFDAGVTAKSSSLLAALAHGTPTVATSPAPASEHPTQLDGVLRVPPCDTAALTEALHLILTDRSLADRLSSTGRAHAARHSWTRIASVHAMVYAALRDTREVTSMDGTRDPGRAAKGRTIRSGGVDVTA